MVYPPEGLFYIEMDQAPPGKLGLKAAIVWFVGGRNVSKTAFAIFPACAIISSNACYKVDIVKCAAGADQTVVMEKSCALRSPSGIAQACIAQFTCQLRNTFRRTWRSGFASFLLSQQRTPRISVLHPPETKMTRNRCLTGERKSANRRDCGSGEQPETAALFFSAASRG